MSPVASWHALSPLLLEDKKKSIVRMTREIYNDKILVQSDLTSSLLLQYQRLYSHMRYLRCCVESGVSLKVQLELEHIMIMWMNAHYITIIAKNHFTIPDINLPTSISYVAYSTVTRTSANAVGRQKEIHREAWGWREKFIMTKYLYLYLYYHHCDKPFYNSRDKLTSCHLLCRL